ncbi:hypothetical protein [Neopusillimonas aromaticivorans]|nr:hypothetical protein [Neopusillimonas aromaticivorans]WJJ93881.1 hypothetical protein N7E01_01120 [Neopusillimonas aromaticivorans]
MALIIRVNNQFPITRHKLFTSFRVKTLRKTPIKRENGNKMK